MLEKLLSIFPNFRAYFLLGEAHHFFRKYMGKSKHPVLNTEKVVHPNTITCKWWDTDHQLVAVCQACIASNIKHFDDIMPVSAAMKRKSEERLDTAIHRLEKEDENAAKRSEEMLDTAIHRLEEEEVAEAAVAAAAVAAASAAQWKWKEMKDAAAAAVVVATAAKRKEK